MQLKFTDGKIVKYSDISNFHEGLAAVCDHNDYWGFIDKTGKERIECKFPEVGDFSEGLASYVDYETGLTGFINNNGEIQIPAIYIEASDFHEEVAAVQAENELYGYIDKRGNYIIEPVFKDAWDFHEGWSVVKNNSNQKSFYSFIDKQGNLFGEFSRVKSVIHGGADVEHAGKAYRLNLQNKSLRSLVNSYSAERSLKPDGTRLVKNSSGFYGYLDENGEEKIPCIFSRAREFVNGTAIITLSLSVPSRLFMIGYVNLNGNITLLFNEYRYKDIHDFKEGLAVVSDFKKLYGYIDKNGVETIKCQYESAREFSNGLAYVEKQDGTVGFIDQKGKFKIKIPEVYYSKIENNGTNGTIITIWANTKRELLQKKKDYLEQLKVECLSCIQEAEKTLVKKK